MRSKAELVKRVSAAWRALARARSPAFVAPCLLIGGMLMSAYAVLLLAGAAWALLVLAAWCLASGVVLLRGIEP